MMGCFGMCLYESTDLILSISSPLSLSKWESKAKEEQEEKKKTNPPRNISKEGYRKL